MTRIARRVVTGHDAAGKSVVVQDGAPPQNHPMHGTAIGADFFEIWNVSAAIPELTPTEAREPNEREFTIMPPSGHLVRVIDIYPLAQGGKRTVMHRTQTLDYVIVIEGEVVLILEDSEVVLAKSDVAVQRGTNHAWENRSNKMARLAFFHISAQFSPALLSRLPQPLELMR
jgi:mannose-6-phosphate isomerase-like protein (cupin superfamily)